MIPSEWIKPWGVNSREWAGDSSLRGVLKPSEWKGFPRRKKIRSDP